MNILLVTYYFPPKIGGAEDYLYNIYERLNPQEVVVLTQNNPQAGEFNNSQNFKIFRTNFFSSNFKPTWWPLVKLVKNIINKHNIQIIHFGHYAHYVLLARFLKTSYLVYIQGTDLTSYSRSWFSKWLMKSNLNKAQKIITVSHHLKNKILKLGIKQEVQVIHPGLNLEQYDLSFTKGDLASVRGRPHNPKIILSVGRLVHLKGFDLVIRALPKILEKIPNIIYIIVGDGPEKQNLQNLTVKFGVENNVIFAGEIRDKKELSKYYSQTDLYVGPSRSEGFGIVFLEARAFGLPIVATNVGGIPEAVGDRGVLVETQDVKALTISIIKALQNPKKYSPDRNFDWDKKIEEIQKTVMNYSRE